MSTSGDAPSQAALLEKIQDDIVYAIECLVYDHTGEAKSEVSDLVDSLSRADALSPEYRDSLQSSLEEILNALRLNSYDKTARSNLITLRRKIANTRLVLAGDAIKYNYANALGAKA